MALIRRLAVRRQIRRTSEEALAINPLFTGPVLPAAEPQRAPHPRLDVTAPAPTPPNAPTVQEPNRSIAADPPPAATANEHTTQRWSQPERPQPPAETGAPPREGATPGQTTATTGETPPLAETAPDMAPTPSPLAGGPSPTSESPEVWQLPQWHYTTKRAQKNQRQPRR